MLKYCMLRQTDIMTTALLIIFFIFLIFNVPITNF